MEDVKKMYRILDMYETLYNGGRLKKSELETKYVISGKTVQRYIEDLRCYLAEKQSGRSEIVYDPKSKTYYLEQIEREWFESNELLAVCKVLLESRAFNDFEMKQLMQKFMMQIPKTDRTRVNALLQNEVFSYKPLKHNQALIEKIWDLSTFIEDKEYIEIQYTKQGGGERLHKIKPITIMFSEFYFYLVAYMADVSKTSPTVFRIDRILSYKSTNDNFVIPYKDKFSYDEFRSRVQFMHTGELKTVKFLYKGPMVEAVLDRLPSAEILKEDSGVYTIRVECFGNGIDMWLKSQGENVEVV